VYVLTKPYRHYHSLELDQPYMLVLLVFRTCCWKELEIVYMGVSLHTAIPGPNPDPVIWVPAFRAC